MLRVPNALAAGASTNDFVCASVQPHSAAPHLYALIPNALAVENQRWFGPICLGLLQVGHVCCHARYVRDCERLLALSNCARHTCCDCCSVVTVTISSVVASVTLTSALQVSSIEIELSVSLSHNNMSTL